MTVISKLHQGTVAWFEMVGTLMSEAALNDGLSPELDFSLVERYLDGVELSEGLVQGIRFEISGGMPSFRVGAQPGERAEVTIEVTAEAARELNGLYSADPNYHAACVRFLSKGDMRVDGDLSRMSRWLTALHDPIVDRTC